MFGMSNNMLAALLKPQLENLKKAKIELERQGVKQLYLIKDHKLSKGQACLYLEDEKTGEFISLRLKI